MAVRMLIHGKQIHGDLLYYGIETQPSAYSSLYLSSFLSFYTLKYLSNFLSFTTLNNEIFVKDFPTTMQARMLIIGTQVDDNFFYCGIENQPSPA